MKADSASQSEAGDSNAGGASLPAQVSADQLRRITAVLAHELRNPLGVLRAGCELMDDSDSANAQLKRLLQAQVDQMTRLVEDLLDTSRSADGKIRLQRRPMELQPVLKDALDGIREMVARRNQRLVTHISDEPLWLNADPLRVMQIVTNLLSNACKYSDPGSECVLSVAGIEGDVVEIRVRDQGIGIDADNLQEVFDFFSQVRTSDSLAHSDGGLGIGLGLVRTLVHLHDGSVWANSDGLGRGSEFVVRLPRCAPAELARAPVAEQRTPVPAKRILIVDDQRSNIYMLRALLEKLGTHELRSASDGVSALAHLTDFTPDVILLDLGLPGMSGVELARAIRRLPHCQQSLLVAVTGYDDDQLRLEAAAAGFDIYQLKPISLDLVREILRSRLSPQSRFAPWL